MQKLIAGRSYTNQDLADWFGIQYKSFSNKKGKKLEELQQYADYIQDGTKIKILKVYQPYYVKGSVLTEDKLKEDTLYSKEEEYLAGGYAEMADFEYNSEYIRERRNAKPEVKFDQAFPFQSIDVVFNKYGLYSMRPANSSEDSPEYKLRDTMLGNTFVYIFDKNMRLRALEGKERELVRIKLNEIYDRMYHEKDELIRKSYKHGIYDMNRAKAKIAVSRMINLSQAIDICEELYEMLAPYDCSAIEMMFFNDPQVLLGIADNIMSTRG